MVALYSIGVVLLEVFVYTFTPPSMVTNTPPDDNGLPSTMRRTSSQSNVVTLEPFSLSKGNIKSKGKRKRDFVVNRSGPCFERLPGLFESNSYDKFLVLSALNGKKIEDLNVFEVHRDIVSCLG